jgi:hypothetical protein
MLDHPVYVRIPTENEETYFRNRSAAEAVISVVASAQKQGWLRLHGFVVMPEALEMVATPIKQGISGVVAQIQAETIPLLMVLLPQAGLVWGRRFTHHALNTQLALDARLNMLLLSPVAGGIVTSSMDFPYSSANLRYSAMVVPYAGFAPESVEMAKIEPTPQRDPTCEKAS